MKYVNGIATIFGSALLCIALQAGAVWGGQVAVRYPEGAAHGFLVLRARGGQEIATGDLIESADGDRMSLELKFRFQDGSLYDETSTFTQAGTFRLLSDHLVQKGPAFREDLDMAIDAEHGRVTVRYTDRGQEKVASERMRIPADLANGLLPILVKNIPAGTDRAAASIIVPTPRPRLLKLIITPAGSEALSFGGAKRETTRYEVRVRIGGVGGMLETVAGRQPPDSYMWILPGAAPALLKSQMPLFAGPMCTVEMAAPALPQNTATEKVAFDAH